MFSVKTDIVFGDFRKEIEKLDLKGYGLLCTRRHGNFDLSKSLNLKILKISPEPSIDEIYRYMDLIKGEKFDFVVALGGGSVLDVSKILSALISNDMRPEDLIGIEKVKNRMIKLVAIPTTHGSGSEVTKYAVVKYKGLKQTIVSKNIVPDFAIIDENLAMDMPADYTLYTSIDAFCHNIEAYLTKFSEPLVDISCEQGIKFFFEGIDEAMNNEIKGRKKMMLCSVLGGIAITNIRTTIIHALSHVIGVKGIPHGLANAVFLKAFMKFYRNDDKFKNLNKILGFDVFKRINEIYEKYNVKNLGDFLDKSEALEVAVKAFENKRLIEIGRKKVELEDLKKIVLESMQ